MRSSPSLSAISSIRLSGRNVLRLNTQIALAVDAYHSFRDAHHAFHAPDRRQTRPFEQGHGVENGFGVKNPAAGVIALAAIEAATPALMGR